MRQFADICLFSTAQYKCTVDEKVGSLFIYFICYLYFSIHPDTFKQQLYIFQLFVPQESEDGFPLGSGSTLSKVWIDSIAIPLIHKSKLQCDEQACLGMDDAPAQSFHTSIWKEQTQSWPLQNLHQKCLNYVTSFFPQQYKVFNQ